MGSSFSILNDTSHDVWVTHGVNWTVALATVVPITGVLTAGAGLAALGAGAGAGGALLGGGALIIAEEGLFMGTTASTLAGLTATQWTWTSIVTGVSASSLATFLGISKEKAAEIQQKVKLFQASAELIKPGEKYTYSGSLSLTMTVYVMNDKLQTGNRACWTGPTANSEYVYPISEYFETLSKQT